MASKPKKEGEKFKKQKEGEKLEAEGRRKIEEAEGEKFQAAFSSQRTSEATN